MNDNRDVNLRVTVGYGRCGYHLRGFNVEDLP